MELMSECREGQKGTRKGEGEVYKEWRAKNEDGAEERPAERTERRKEARRRTGCAEGAKGGNGGEEADRAQSG